jgi:hypothetical protein
MSKLASAMIVPPGPGVILPAVVTARDPVLVKEVATLAAAVPVKSGISTGPRVAPAPAPTISASS